MNKPLPQFKSDQEAEDFIDTADLSEYDLSGFRSARFIFDDHPDILRFRMSPAARTSLLEAAAKKGLSEEDFIRDAVETAIAAARS